MVQSLDNLLPSAGQLTEQGEVTDCTSCALDGEQFDRAATKVKANRKKKS